MVEKLFDSECGGFMLYQFELSGCYCYYYVYLQCYVDGIVEKKVIWCGEVIGYVGSIGNVLFDVLYLYFEIYCLGVEW